MGKQSRKKGKGGVKAKPTLPAAQRIGRALAATTDQAAIRALLVEAEQTAERLRLAGSLAEALAVAQAGGRRSARLCLEEALAAFARGQTELAAEAAAAHPEAVAVMAPLLAAGRGEEVQKPRKKLSDRLTGLYAAASVMSAVRAGDWSAAKKALGKIPTKVRATLQHGMLADGAAVELGDPDAVEQHTWVLLARPFGRVEGHREVILRAAARCSPRALPERPLDAAEVRAVLPVLMAHPDTTEELTAELVARAGPAAFRPEDEATAALFAAFGTLQRDPQAALTAFATARARGADRVEALRGQVLAGLAISERAPSRGAARELVRVAVELAERLEAVPGGAPPAVVLYLHAVVAAIDAGLPDRSRELQSRAQALAEADGFGEPVREATAVLEVCRLRAADPMAALDLLDAKLLEHPRVAELWEMKAGYFEEVGDRAKLVQTLEAARDATGHPVFAARLSALGVRPRLTLKPGESTAGELVAEIARRLGSGEVWAEDVLLPPDLAACWAPLHPNAQVAVDGALLVAAVGLGQEGRAEALLASRLEALAPHPQHLGGRMLLMALAVLEGLEERVTRVVEALADGSSNPSLRGELIDSALYAGEIVIGERLLLRWAARLTPPWLRRLKQELGKARRRGWPELGPHEGALDDLFDAHLRPHSSLRELRALLAGEGDEAEEGPEERALLSLKALMEKLPADRSAAQLQQAMMQLMKILDAGPSFANFARLQSLLAGLGLSLDDLMEVPVPRAGRKR